MSSIVLFAKPGCHLCDEASEAMVRAGLVFRQVDITADPALEAEFGILIPVVEVDGSAVFQAGMDAGSLPELIAEAEAEGRV